MQLSSISNQKNYIISKHAAVVTHDIEYMIRQHQQTLLTHYQESYKLLSLSLLFRKLISLQKASMSTYKYNLSINTNRLY